nr:MAG TPA: hypothetical protein [Caudoviricetes sp.]
MLTNIFILIQPDRKDILIRLGYVTFSFGWMGISFSFLVHILRLDPYYICEAISLHRILRITLFQLATNLGNPETSDSILLLM